MEVLLKLKNQEGMHARPAGMFAKKASEFKSNIQVVYNGQAKSAKSIMGLMSLCLKKDMEFTLIADGPDAEQATSALKQLIENEFKA